MDESELINDTDRRVTGKYLRQVSISDVAVTLVGVAHDHPASVHRVRAVIERCDPDTVAVELPPLAVPRFEQYATGAETPPTAGGEMSAAIQAAPTDAVVGIDRSIRGYCRRLLETLVRVRPDPQTVREALSQACTPLSHAVRCRLSAALPDNTPPDFAVEHTVDHGVDRSDDPATQAADEHKQVQRSRAVLDSLGSQHRRRGSQIEREAREAEMADRLARLDGTAVAVVGISHLDPLVERLRADKQ